MKRSFDAMLVYPMVIVAIISFTIGYILSIVVAAQSKPNKDTIRMAYERGYQDALSWSEGMRFPFMPSEENRKKDK